jgi:hypothetical protein
MFKPIKKIFIDYAPNPDFVLSLAVAKKKRSPLIFSKIEAVQQLPVEYFDLLLASSHSLYILGIALCVFRGFSKSSIINEIHLQP